MRLCIEDYWERTWKTSPFPVSLERHGVTGSLRRCNCNPTLPPSHVKPCLLSLQPPPVKIIIHLLGSHSSPCPPERYDRSPHLSRIDVCALMGFYCLMHPLSSSFFSKSNLLSLGLLDLPFKFILSFPPFPFHICSIANGA